MVESKIFQFLKFLTGINFGASVFVMIFFEEYGFSSRYFIASTLANLAYFISTYVNTTWCGNAFGFLISWLYLPLYIIGYLFTPLDFILSLNYPLFTALRLNQLSLISDFLVYIPLPLLLFHLYFVSAKFFRFNSL